VAVLALIGFFAYRTWIDREPATPQASGERISASALEERYGVQVKLIGVTAGGGMIDLRLKIVNAAKARRLLQDPANLPALIVQDGGTTLKAPESVSYDLNLESGGVFFVLFPNTRGVIRPGTPVTVGFGDVRLDPIIAQ
jgi:hypothetical protein